METAGSAKSRYYGYRTPFHDEVCSERYYYEELQKPGSTLVPFGRQLKVFEREKLDLLALDAHANLWLFEFKRDVVPYEAIAQLITYGSFVSQWGREEMMDRYKALHPKRNLTDDFHRRFKFQFPPQLSTQVYLVLAGYEFSLACRRGLEFLKQSVGLVVGRLKIDCLWDANGATTPEYQWLQDPTPTKKLEIHVEPVQPEAYFTLALSADDLTPNWSECMSNGLLPVPARWKIRELPIPVSSGIFVNLCLPPEEEDLNPGLVGYGMTTGVAFDLRSHLTRFELTERTLAEIRDHREPIWVLEIRWLYKSVDLIPVKPSEMILQESGLVEINPDVAQTLKEDLNIESFRLF